MGSSRILFVIRIVPTIRKTRIVAQNQQVVRVDWEKTHTLSEAVFEQVFDFVRDEILDAGVIILSDYGKGLITRKFMEKIMVASQRHGQAAPCVRGSEDT